MSAAEIIFEQEERDMLLQTVRPNIVQSIRAYRVDDLMRAARQADQHFLYANLAAAQFFSPRISARTSMRCSTA